MRSFASCRCQAAEKILAIAFLALFPCFSQASELRGTLSTSLAGAQTESSISNPNGDANGSAEGRGGQSYSGTSGSHGGSVLRRQATSSVADAQKAASSSENGTDEVLVLGVMHYADHSLLRSEDRRIYFIEGSSKKPIRNMRELEKYRGQKIYDVSFEDLSLYETRNYLDGDLIRMQGIDRIYFIRHGKAMHIRSLAQLKKDFRGKGINTLSILEMAEYLD